MLIARVTRMVLVAAVLAVAGLAVPEAAWARKGRAAAARKAKRAQAKRLFERAQIQYRLGRFGVARKLYTRAYEVLPLPGFLYNIAQCHRMEKRYERALFFYKSYLGARANARNRDVVMELMTRCEQRLKEARRRAEARKRAQVNRRRVSTRRSALRLHPKPYLPPAAPASTPVTKRWWFWTSIAGGVVALVVTGVVAGLFARPPAFEQTDLGVLDRRAR